VFFANSQTDDGGYAAVGFNKYSHVSGLQDVLMVKMDASQVMIAVKILSYCDHH
jgi:hypothetical protein